MVLKVALFQSSVKSFSCIRLAQSQTGLLHLCRQFSQFGISSTRSILPIQFNITQQLVQQNRSLITETKEYDKPKDLSEKELLRWRADKIERASLLRSRCAWTKEEDEKLLRLIDEQGKRWTRLSQEFVDRSASNVMNRYRILSKDPLYYNPKWTQEELDALTSLGENKNYDSINNWKEIQMKLPKIRPILHIRLAYKHTCDPTIKHGRWTEEESYKLQELIQHFGEENMEEIARLMGSRTKRQCLERWRWQMKQGKKGHFSLEEDVKIKEAVEKYGENFAVVRQVTGIDRSPRHISQHFRNVLDPSIDRSRWTFEEEKKVYEACIKNDGSMIKTKEELGSLRAVRDMWNHFNRIRKMKKEK